MGAEDWLEVETGQLGAANLASRMSFRSAWPRFQPYLYPAAAPLVLLLVLYAVLLTGALDRLENLTVDYRFRQRAENDPQADPRIILVKIDQKSLDKLGGWPWNRSVHGDLCTLLAQAGIGVVGFDILFTEPRDPDDDKHLGEGMGKPHAVVSGAMLVPAKRGAPVEQSSTAGAPSVIDWGKTRPLTHVEGDLSKITAADTALYPIPEVRGNSLFAFVNSDPSSVDGIRRNLSMVFRVGPNIFPGLSLQILCQYWNLSPDQIHVRLGRDIELPTSEGVKSIPIDASGKMLVNYRNKASFSAIPYADLAGALYDQYVNGNPYPPDYPALKGKIFVVGQTEPGLSDLGPSPLESESPLVLVHLNALNNILKGDYLRQAKTLPVALGWLAVSWATLLYVREKNILFSVLAPTACVGVYVVLAQILFNTRSILVPVAWPVTFFVALHLGSVLLHWLKEQQSRQQIKQVFSSYIAPTVLERLLEHPENIQLGGVRMPVTTLFSDIRGFTTLSESMGEEELVSQLNEYFEKMVDCVNRYQGTLHKYIGDAVMAAWGDVVPETPAADAAKAVRSALAMRAELIELNKMWAEQDRKQFKIGIGLNHGIVTVGNIGATQRREFTLIGDPVNVASRLEGVTKEYQTDLAIGESVHELVRGEFLTRTLGVIVVKGKTKGLRVYEVLDDLKAPVGAWPAEWIARYEKAMEAYLARKFPEAQGLFEECLRERPEDYCSKLYVMSCKELIKNPPPSDWSGTHVMKTK